MESVDLTIRHWIVDVLTDAAHAPAVRLAARQRAKFEGWLKFELASRAVADGAMNVTVEARYGGASARADLSLMFNGVACQIELKTPNSNWRMDGVENKHRPITKNIVSVVADAKKLRESSGNGVMAFVLFPIPVGDVRWHDYLSRIADDLQIPLSEARHCSRVTVSLTIAQRCEFVVCCFNPAG